VAIDWADLPADVRADVESHIGTVTEATSIRGGQNNDLAALVHTSTGPTFVKGVRGISRPMRFLRNEVAAAPLVTGLGPALRFALDLVGDDGRGWYLAGFDWVPGRPVDLHDPVDLATVSAALERLAAREAGELQGLDERWAGGDMWSQAAELAAAEVTGWDIDALAQLAAAAPAAVHGNRLAHTDLHADQFIVTDGRVHLIDWGWPAAAAPWVDTAYMVIRLVEAGHPATDAESWARTLPTWAGAAPADVTAFAAYVAGLWTVFAAKAPGPGARRRAAAARTYAAWRLGSQT
jgi:hypothetical protein